MTERMESAKASDVKGPDATIYCGATSLAMGSWGFLRVMVDERVGGERLRDFLRKGSAINGESTASRHAVGLSATRMTSEPHWRISCNKPTALIESSERSELEQTSSAMFCFRRGVVLMGRISWMTTGIPR